MRKLALTLILSCALALPAFAQEASEVTINSNQALKNYLPFADKTDFQNATKGFIATLEDGLVKGSDGSVAFDLNLFNFLETEAPDTVNPSLWRQSQLNAIHGLFEVVPGKIYQVRAFDLAVMSFIRGDNGWIVVDPLTVKESAAAAMQLLREKVEDLPVTAIIMTHSHIDHFGGIKGIITQEDVVQRNVPIIAPEGFFEEAVSENLLAGNAMNRRASYMFGNLLPKDAKGTVGSGLGTTTPDVTFTITTPNVIISESPTELTLDGIDMTFLNTPGAEAPAELVFYIPRFKAFMQAEEINHTQHNLYTLRGAKVRSGDKFAKYINDVINRWGKDVEVSFGSHHWPTWGNQEIVSFWTGQRDTYRYIHDETLRLANQGYTMLEIADRLTLPDSLATKFANRGYYGSVSHNAKAQYQLYFGWFSGNPSELNELPPVEEGRKFVEYAGGADALLAKAKTDFNDGQYRWVATALNHLVFADPENMKARQLLAETLTQLGYQSENAPWRNFYLTGAKELRNGIDGLSASSAGSPDMIRALPLENYLDFLAVRLNHPQAANSDLSLNFILPDVQQQFTLSVTNGVLNYTIGIQAPNADATATIDRGVLDSIYLDQLSLDDAMAEGSITIEGDPDKLGELISLLDSFDFWFDIVLP